MSASQRLFGTDGVRGAFGEPPLDEETVRSLACALLSEIEPETIRGSRPLVVLGGDTRESTPVISEWITSSLAEVGVDTIDLGVVPTPGVAFETRQRQAAFGVVVSASHNPWQDNGIKLLTAEGFKISQQTERRLQEKIQELRTQHIEGSRRRGQSENAKPEHYVASLVESIPPGSLGGLRIALDAGNGAASAYAAAVFERCGACVAIEGDQPNGRNINLNCGSTAPERIAKRVRAEDFDLGFAFDGDADRVIVCDQSGTERDGDAILYLWARHLNAQGRLRGRAIVATSMSNIGLERSLRPHGVRVVRCDVGDRFVVETLRRDGLRLGGEKSGHLIDLELSTTGDGMLCALQVARIVSEESRTLEELLTDFELFPQRLRSIEVEHKPDLDTLPRVLGATRSVQRELGDLGRVVLRYSGTENVARIMVEGPDVASVDRMVAEIAEAVELEIGSR